MWLVDFFFEYFSEGAAYFQQSFSEILNDSLLGLSAVTWGAIAWLAILLVKDPSVCSNSNKSKRRLHRSRPFSLPEKILDKSSPSCRIMHKMDEFHHFPLHFFIEYV